ncbi:hypothetical protein AFLA_003603 [Aspergillus flavus NRRL3357]|nr:hypothetical protein AFLA_003603 [Aspergillus flavus NRRL3357]
MRERKKITPAIAQSWGAAASKEPEKERGDGNRLTGYAAQPQFPQRYPRGWKEHPPYKYVSFLTAKITS